MRQDQFHLLDREAFAQFVGDALGAAGKPHQHRAMNRIEHDGPWLRTVFAFPGAQMAFGPVPPGLCSVVTIGPSPASTTGVSQKALKPEMPAS